MNAAALAADQKNCPEVEAHRSGKHPKGIRMTDVEYSPGVTLLCETSTGRSRPFVPQQWRQLIFRLFHSLTHTGQKATVKNISHRYYWPSLRTDVSEWVKTCEPCLQCKEEPTITPPCKPREIGQSRFSELMIDVVGPLNESHGYTYLLTILCRKSRWLEAIPMKEATARSCADAFIQGWVQRFGLPCRAISDNGSTFISGLWRDLHERLGTIVSYTPPYHPSSLGHVERTHRSLKMGLKTTLLAMSRDNKDWYSNLPWVLLGRRTSFQPELNTSPAELVLGSHPRLPGDLLDAGPEAVADILESVRTKAARPPVQPSQHRTVPVNFPEKARSATHVYVKRGKKAPLGPAFDGPLEITERLGIPASNCDRVHTSAANPDSKFNTGRI